MTIATRPLGRTGHQATILGLGGEGILRTYGEEKKAQAVIEAALAAGIRYFESARAYSGSEDYLGKGLKGHRQKIFLTSKSHGRSYKEAMAHLSITLKKLDTDYLDLWQIHDVRTAEDLEAITMPGGILEAFREAKEKGWTRFIGVTGHHDPEILRRALDLYDFDTVLLPVNPAEPQDRSFLPLAADARERGLGVIGMKVLCRGLLPRMAEEPGRLTFDLVAYALSQPVSLVVIGGDTPGQVKALAHAAANFTPMSPEERKALEDAVAPFAQRLMYYKP
ncbi:MAG: aldo/keto reductase [Syntrophales bacterium]|nr:aldo/keto reductase [Syntrophales bacterium]MDD5641678.1 aldo/keto reductase [Syntrophales bacterium]